MRIEQVIGETGPLVQLCKGGACPAAIIAEDGNAYIQGYELAAGEKAALTAPQEEGFVRMPLATLKRIAEQVMRK